MTLEGKLPDFIIAGIEKSGTTSMFVNLSKHPQIEMTPNALEYMKSGLLDNIKEPHFFNKRWSNGLDWYRGLFNDNDKLQGEAASNYLFNQEYIKRMASIVPHARIIVSLRNPVTRAYSQYSYFKEFYRKSMAAALSRFESNKTLFLKIAKLRNISFDEAIKDEIKKGVILGEGFIGKGFYMDLIENLLKHYPRQQVLFIISEQMKKDMQGTYQRLFEFLGLEDYPINFDRDVLVSPKDKEMDVSTQECLRGIYHSSNERLFQFLGGRVPEWEMR